MEGVVLVGLSVGPGGVVGVVGPAGLPLESTQRNVESFLLQ